MVEERRERYLNHSLNYTLSEYARISGKTEVELEGDIKTGKIISYVKKTTGNNIETEYLPSWQFDENGNVFDFLEEPLKILHSGELSGFGKAVFFLQRRYSTNGKSLLDFLKTGGDKKVVEELAKDYIS